MAELGQLVEEEDPAMAESDLAGPWDPATANQARVGDGVVRRSEGRLPMSGEVDGSKPLTL